MPEQISRIVHVSVDDIIDTYSPVYAERERIIQPH